MQQAAAPVIRIMDDRRGLLLSIIIQIFINI